MKIGVLDLQGAVEEHIHMVEQCGHQGIRVKTLEDLNQVEKLILPGGESTTIGRLASIYGLDKAIIKKAKEGLPIFGTCAGMILLAQEIEGYQQVKFDLIDITVERNAFGRQVDSFEAKIKIKGIKGENFRAVFIRAPYIKRAGEEVEILAEFENKIIMARQGKILVSAFHPELTDDLRVHQYFLGKSF